MTTSTPSLPAAASEPEAGPVSRRRSRATAVLYIAMCVIGLLAWSFGSTTHWQAAGLGLWFPGAGFLALGPWGSVAAIFTLTVFCVAIVAWFGSGMIIAPIFVWLGSAALAGRLAGASPWQPAPWIVVGATVLAVAYLRYRQAKKLSADLAVKAVRDALLPEALQELRSIRLEEPAAGARELCEEQLQALRYALDRALQPVGTLNGFDKRDQFQTAATRYQINALSYAISLSQCHYTPSFHGYVSLAQRNLIEQYLRKPVWDYWIYESAWGHLNFSNHDPVGKDNIMLTGFFALQVGLYTSNTNDRRYFANGSLTFGGENRRGKQYAHRYQDLTASIAWNQKHSDFCLYPCEPNWIYPICNHYGMTALVLGDRLSSTRTVEAMLPRWLNMLDTELSDPKGSPVPLKSSLVGWVPPFPTFDGMYVPYGNTFMPERSERQWAIARTELAPLIVQSAEGNQKLKLPGVGIDFGNYRKGHGASYAQIAIAALEMGDEVLADLAQRSLDEDAGLDVSHGIRRYKGASNIGNAWAVQAAFHRRNDFRNAVCRGPAASALTGPILADAKYPDVLVAKAFSRSHDLELTLYPGGEDIRTHRIGIERLQPNRSYWVRGAESDQITADAEGRVTLNVILRGRTAIYLSPKE